jgi:filamentous hemagglutinin family protein
MTHYTKKRIETVSNSFRKNALSVAISALSTTLAGVRDGLKGGVYVTLIAGQVVAPVAWAANLPELAAGQESTISNTGSTLDGVTNLDGAAEYTITGSPSRALVEWDSFDISQNYGVEFKQGGSNNILINQINSGAFSEISGLLKADGNIILVNPNGVTLTGTSVIDVNSLAVAGFSGGGDLTDFLDGTIDDLDLGSGSGVITIQDGANLSGIDQGVVLVGGSVLNGADIAVANYIGMGAGTGGAITFDENNIIGFSVDGEVATANALKSLGDLTATGGTIFLSASAAGTAINSALNIEGTVQAATINIDSNKITLGELGQTANHDVNISATNSLSLSNLSKVTIESGADYSITAPSVSLSADFSDITTSAAGQITANGVVTKVGDASPQSGLSIDALTSAQLDNGSVSTNTSAGLIADSGLGLNNSLQTNGISFSGVSSAELNNNVLSGSVGTDSFEVTGTALTANAISVTNAATAIDAGNGDDTVTVNDANSTLTGTDNALNTANYQFTSIESADLTSKALTGTAGVDTFDVTGHNELTSADIDFTNVASVDAGDGDDQVNTDAAALVADTNEALVTNSISFTDIESADLDSGELTGTTGTDTFDVTGANALTSADIDFTNVSSVNANGGDDQINTNAATLVSETDVAGTVAVDNALKTQQIAFTAVENLDLASGALVGSDAADTFAVTGSALTANAITVTNAASGINAGDGADVLTVNDTNSTLTGTDNELDTANYAFSSVETVDLADNALTGTANADTFDVTGANALTSAGINFSSVAAVNADDGADQVNTDGADASLFAELGSAVDYALETLGITFRETENANLNGGTLAGSSEADNFEVTGDALTANAMTITNAASAIDAGTGDDAVTVNDANSALTGTDNELDTANYEFSSVETVDLADNALTGTSGVDTFDVTGDNALTSAGINFSNVASVDAGNGDDQLNTNGATLVSDTGVAVVNALTTQQIAFTAVENLDLANGTLTGSDAADSFEVTGTTLTANAITVTNAASGINAGDGTDVLTVNDTNSALTGTDNELDTANYEFSSVETVDLADNALTGTVNADIFDVTSANALTSAGIDFTNVEVVNADDGTDQVNTDGADASLFAELGDAVDYALETLGITFRETENADLNGGTLAGSSEADSFEVTGSALTANAISVTNAASGINAGDGVDVLTVNDTNSTLTGIDNELDTANYAFSSVETVDLADNALTGTANADTFDVTGANALTSADIDFTNVASVDANDGDDQVNTNGATLTSEAGIAVDNALTTQQIAFTSVENLDLANGALAGSDAADSFEVNGVALTANAISVTKAASAINAGDGTDVLTVNDANSTLTGTDNELDTANYEFSSVETVDLVDNALTGTSGADTFDVTGANALTSAGIDFTNVASVDAGNGDDQVNTNAATLVSQTDGAGTVAVDNALTTQQIAFTSVENLDLANGALTGSDAADSFEVTGVTLTANAMTVTNAASAINAGDGDDVLIVNDGNSTLTGTDNELETANYEFLSVEVADLADNALTGTANADTFDVTGTNALTSAGIDFSNVEVVNADDGADQVNTNGATLVSDTGVAVDNALTTQQIAFTSVENLDLANGTLTGSDAADRFEVTGSALTANAISVTNAASAISAGSGDDEVTVNDASSALTGTDNELDTANYEFSSVETVNLANNALTGTSGADTFDVTGANALTSAGIDFTNVEVVNADDGADQVNTGGADASLFAELGSAVDYALETLGITFRETENLDLNGGTLAGSSEADSFEVTAATLTANEISVTNAASAINAGNGDDTVVINDTNSTLTGADNALSTANYQLTSIEAADLQSNALTGTAAADTFDVTGANALTSADIDFTNVASVDANDGDDQVNTNGATLVSDTGAAVDNALTTQQIAFTSVENLDLANGTLAGSDAADSFAVTGSALTANEITVTNAASAIDAGTGDDAITVNDTNSTLTGTDNELNTADYQFTSIESADLTTKALTGTSGADTFNVTGANALSSADIDFTNVASVDAGNGSDQVNTNAAALVSAGTVAVDNALTTQQIAFTSVENLDLASGTLTGSDAADSFEVTGTALTANEISVTNAASAINAGNGDDALTVNDANSTLTGTDNELDTANYEFSSVETVNLADNALTGTSGADTFDVTGANALTSAGIDFTNVEVVNADDGADQVNTGGADASLFAELGSAVDYALETLGITFRETENANLNGGKLAGSSEADSFEVTGAALIANEINITNAASAINAGNGDDSVIVNDANSELTGTDNALNTANYQFTSIEEANLNGGTLAGSSEADSFEVTGTALTANAISIENAASAINAGNGDDSVTVNDANSTLTGTDNALDTANYQFTSIESADLTTNALTGTADTDTFDVTGVNALTSADIDFTNVASVDAGIGVDQVNTNGATLDSDTGVAVDNALTTQQIAFTSVENLDLASGTLTGSDAADSFEVTGSTLTANAISVTNAASAIDAGTGDDAITVNDTNSTLTGTDNELNTANYQFTSIESADLTTNSLTGTSGADTFDVTGANAMTSADIDFTNVSLVNANDGDDQVNTNGAALVSGRGLAVATDNALMTQQIAFTSIENLELANGTLTGSDAVDTFEVTGTALTANQINVTNAASAIDAGTGDDAVTVNDANSTLTGTDNELDTADYEFTSVETADLAGNALTGTAGDDTFDVTGTNELTVSNIDFTSIAAVNAGDGADQVNTDGADASMFAELGNAVDYALETLGITFRETENADLNGGTLAGSSEADSFEVTGTALTANEINITNAASAINAGNGDDSVVVNDANSTLTGTDNALNTANYQFTSIETADLASNALTGTANADTFDVTGANALTSADIDFTNVASVDANDGDDQVNTNGAALTSDTGSAVDNALTTQQIAFTSVENLDLSNGTLAGSDAADTFEVTGSNLTANAINVTNAASGINAGNGDDALTVHDANSTLTGTDNELDTANYQFTSIEAADLQSNALTSTTGDITFDVTGENALTSAGIAFTNVEAVNDAGESETINTNGADASLFAELGSAVENALETLGIVFRGVLEADLGGGTLTGSTEADSFEVTGTTLTANGIVVTNAASVIDAGTGDDAVTVNDANSALTGTDNALDTANYQFTSIDSADLTDSVLTGTSGADTFDVTGANALTSADIDFTNVASVDAGIGADQVNTNGATLVSDTGAAVDSALTTQQIAFTSVENLDLANGTLTGSDAADTFEVTGSNLTANAINVTNAASAISAGDGADVLTVNDTNSTLTGTDNELDTANYEFSSVETVDLADNALTGTANADTFDVTGANALNSAGINFSNVAVVNAGNGADQVNTGGADASLFAELGNAVDYALETLGITFRETENADLNGGTLAGSSEADSFEVTGTVLTANEINITNAVSAINAGNGDDSVIVNDANSTLTGTDNALDTANYQFTSIENADLATNALTGTSGVDTFDVTGANTLTSAGIDFTNVEVVNAGDDADQVNTDGADASLFAELGSAVDYALETLGITFRETENLDLNGGTLAGGSEADSFEVTGTALTANEINITNAASAINAGNGDDSVIVNDANSTLTGSDNALNTANYQFTSIESADLTTNALTGTSGADTFDVTGANALTSADIDFTNVASVDADDGDDQVNTNGATLTSETGTAVDNALTTQQIAFTAVENLDLAGGTLAGSDAADTLEATGSALTANGISVTNAASAINAGDGVDSLTVNDANSTLTGADNAVDTANYQFTSVETADLAGNALTGTAGDDIFDVSAPNALTSADIDFTNVASVDAGNGDDQVNTNAATLVSETNVAGTVAVDNALTTQQIAFTSVENLDLANGALVGSDAADSFEVTGAALTANAISVTNAASAINAGDGADTLTVNDASSTLTGTDNELDTANYEFSSVETVNLADNALTGTSGVDTFDVTGANALTSAGINFSNVSAVNADDGADQVNTDGADASLFAEIGNAVDYALETLGITFRATENANLNGGTLAGSTEADSFEVTGATLTANAITVTNAASAINAGNGDDTVTVNDTNSTLTGADNALNTANYQFTSIETADLQSNVLTGTAGADTFDVTGANALTSADIDFTNVESVDAGNGDDQVNTNGATLASESGSAVDNALTTQQIAFTSVENLDLANGTLAGSDAADSFDVTGATLTANAINVTNAASAINAGNGADALTVNDANSTLTGADNALDTASYEFTSVETADLQGNALTGTSGADTFDVTGSNALTSAAINFTDLASVDAMGGNDQVNTDGATLVSDAGAASDNALETQGIAFTNVDSVDLANGALTATDAAETFNTGATSGQVDVNDMTITSVATIDAGDGSDSLVAANDAVVALNGTELGLIASDIVFSNLEAAGLSSGTLNGTAANDEFALVGANQFFSNGILFSDVANVDGGTGTDSITTSAATSAELTVTDNALVAQSIRFDAIESADLSGGTLNDVAAQTEIFTLGDESASVSTKEILFTSVSQVSAGTDDQIQGSTGDDTFTIRSDEQVAANDILFDGPLTLLGSDGDDTLVNEIDGVRWLINAVGNGINQVGKFTFSQFESLFNNVGALDLATSMQADFNGESVSFGDNTMTLNFDGSENVELLSTYGSGVSVQAEGDPIAITGSVTADELLILSYGDIELRTDINLISIQTLNGQSIDVTMIQNGDLVIRSIDIEGGTLVLDSRVAGTGSLTSETINTTDVSALNAYIGTGESGVEGAGEWASIGETNNQLTFEVALRLDLEAITFVSPFFPNGAPLVYNTEGTETDSLISSQSPALVIVDSVGDVSQLNPAVFEALSPFIADANAVAGSSGYYASSDVPSTLDTELLASLLASYEPTASGSPEGYQVGDEEEDEDAQASGSGINTDQEIRIAYSDTGEVLGVVQNYVFKAGDSLWKLSERFLGTGYAWNSIMEQNPEIESPSSIKNGTVIRVIKSVSDEVAQAIQNALDSGLGVKKGNTVTFPVDARSQLNM